MLCGADPLTAAPPGRPARTGGLGPGRPDGQGHVPARRAAGLPLVAGRGALARHDRHRLHARRPAPDGGRRPRGAPGGQAVDRGRLPDRRRPDARPAGQARALHVLPVLPARRRRRGGGRRRGRPLRRGLPGASRTASSSASRSARSSSRRASGSPAATSSTARCSRVSSSRSASAPGRLGGIDGPLPRRLGRPPRRRGDRRAGLPGRAGSARRPRVALRAMAWNIVIAGGGFGGLYAARTLEKVLAPHAARITLVNDVNFMLYTPLLPGAAAGTLEPRHVVVPLREKLKRTDLRIGSVTGADPDKRELLGPHARGPRWRRCPTTSSIVAIGSVSRTLPIPGLSEHGDRLQDAVRGDRAAQLHRRQPRARRDARHRGRARALPLLRLRRRGLRRGRGAGRAPGLHGGGDRALPALSHPGNPLRARRGPRPDHGRDPGGPRRVRRAGAAGRGIEVKPRPRSQRSRARR